MPLLYRGPLILSEENDQMSEHVKQLEPKIRKIQEHIKRMGTEDQADLLWQIIHRPGWTTIIEGQFVAAMLDSVTQHLEAADKTHRTLVSIAEKVGGADSAKHAA